MKKPSPAFLVATLALAVAATGTAGAAGGWINGNRIKPRTITSLQLAAGAVKAKNVSAHAITKQALADGVIVNNTAVGPTGPQGPAGAAGQPGAPGVARAYASVYADGTIDTARTAGIISVIKGPTGVYCVTPSLDVSVHSVSVTPTSETGPIGPVIATASILSHPYCGTLIEVRTYTPQTHGVRPR
jgi:hypothetical protein